MDYSNLRTKTILDFTSDAQIINEVVGDKDLFLSSLTNQSRAFTFIDYAELVGDVQLLAAAEKEFESELTTFFDE